MTISLHYMSGTGDLPTVPPDMSIREMSRRRLRLPVLVTVKASPQPSSKYGDTVCVAGTLMDQDNPRWIRLYPVPFRYLEGGQQFSKYAVINVRLHESTQDQRPESAKIDAMSIDVRDTLPAWDSRKRWVEPLVGPTMCAMQRAARSNVDAPSLGAIRPARIDPNLTFSPHGPWSDKQLKALEDAAQAALFGPAPAMTLRPPRLTVRLHFWCHENDCRGHDLQIIDWELTALQGHSARLTDDQLKANITERFMRRMFLNDTDPIIFVGNQADIVRRASFTVLGVYYPKKRNDTTVPMF